MAFSGVVGLWAVGCFTPDLMQYVPRKGVSQKVYQAQLDEARAAGDSASAAQYATLLARSPQNPPPTGPVPAELKPAVDKAEPLIRGRLTIMGGVTSIMINVGAFFGMFGFGYLSQRIGRKPTFAMAFLAAGLSTAAVFLFLKDYSQLFWLIPIMGFCQLSLFSGYAIYFPELFPPACGAPARASATTSGRFVAAFGGWGRASSSRCSPGPGGTPGGPGRSVTRARPCASCSSSACWPCRSPRRPRGSRCLRRRWGSPIRLPEAEAHRLGDETRHFSLDNWYGIC